MPSQLSPSDNAVIDHFAKLGRQQHPLPIEEPDHRELRFFLMLASDGKRRGCSTSERACRQLAELIVRTVPCFDDAAVQGLIDFIHLAKGAPNTAEDAIR